ncbi:MAG: hypothetical protein L0Z53_17390 [Acidobacteriales bacterium]|nr:hypothetical protein [Terriglobales bacterium]
MARKPKMGRPKKPPREVRNTILQIRLSREEYDVLTKAATGELSTWARARLLRIAGRS